MLARRVQRTDAGVKDFRTALDRQLLLIQKSAGKLQTCGACSNLTRVHRQPAEHHQRERLLHEAVTEAIQLVAILLAFHNEAVRDELLDDGLQALFPPLQRAREHIEAETAANYRPHRECFARVIHEGAQPFPHDLVEGRRYGNAGEVLGPETRRALRVRLQQYADQLFDEERCRP